MFSIINIAKVLYLLTESSPFYDVITNHNLKYMLITNIAKVLYLLTESSPFYDVITNHNLKYMLSYMLHKDLC